jgi:hypothetical protein
MDPAFEIRYNRIITELQVRVHNRAPVAQINELVEEAEALFKEIEQQRLTMDTINSILIQNILIKYQSSINQMVRPVSMVTKDTDMLRQTMLLAQQLESDHSDLNTTIYNQGDQIRSWKGSLDQSNKTLDTTSNTLNQIENRWCVIV